MILSRKQKQKNLEKGIKKCTMCNKNKPISEFYSNIHYWDNLSVYCKVCQRKLYKNYYNNKKLKNGK